MAGGDAVSLTLIGVCTVIFCMSNHRKVNPSAASKATTNAAIGNSELRVSRPVFARSAYAPLPVSEVVADVS